MVEGPRRVLCLFHRGFKLFPRGFKQIESLSDAGYEVEVLCAARSTLPRTETHEGVKIRRVQTPWPDFAVLKPLALLWVLLRLTVIGLNEDDIDVIHCFGIYSLLPGIILSKAKTTALTYDAFEDYRYQLERSGAIPVATSYFGQLLVLTERWMVSKSEAVFVVPSADDILERRFADIDTTVTTVWNVPRLREGINPTSEEPDGKAEITVLYVGSISVYKGASEMVEAAVKTLDSVDVPTKFVFIGGHSNETAVELNRLIPSDYEDNIVFPGFVAYEEVKPFLSSADIAIQLNQPTFWNRQSKASSKLFRYMAARLPIVVSDFPGFGSIIRELNAGIPVDPTRPDDAAAALAELVEDEGKRRELGENGYEAFLERYNWEFEEGSFLDAFDSAQTNYV